MHPNDPRVTIDWLKGKIVEYLKAPIRGQMFGHLMAEFGLQKVPPLGTRGKPRA